MRRLALLLLLLLASSNASRRGSKARRANKGRGRCSVAGCSICTRTNRTECETCKLGHALTPEKQCERCGDGCKACSSADACNACKQGFTLVDATCERCALHCLRCDEAGPGGCNECGARRMLHSHLAVEGEVHECLPCGEGCRRCSQERGCEACDWLHATLPNGAGCAFSWMQVGGGTALVLLAVIGCAMCTLADELSDTTRAPRSRDRAEVVRRDDDAGPDVRRRMSSRAERSPPREQQRKEGAYPLMPGYSGIDIVDKYSAD